MLTFQALDLTIGPTGGGTTMKRSSILNTPLPYLSRRAFLSSLSAMTVTGLIELQLVVGFTEGSSGWGNEGNSDSRHKAIW
jgi:hypothetical protein